ncbi:MAG: small multi-drug export protein [Chloroflexota bacterium]|nr:small multi-drug export protein [Chloroflexota bacterium]
MPGELVTFLTAMAPVGELRAAVPLGIVQYGLSWQVVLPLAVLGNLAPVPFVLLALHGVGERVERMDNLSGALLRWRTRRLEERWGARVRRYEFIAVLLMVAIPLPFTGAWTGCLAVWSLRVPLRKGLPAIAAGVAVAGIIVVILVEAGVEAFRHV